MTRFRNRTATKSLHCIIMPWLPARDSSTHPALCAGSLRIRTRYLPAQAGAGGDLYDVEDTPFGLRLLVGDVMGAGRPANQTGVVVRKAWQAIAATEPTLAGIAGRLHGLIARSAHPDRFVTAFLATFGAGPRTEFVCCGHPPPLLLRGTAATFLDPCPPAPPLGLLDMNEGWCTPGTFRLTPGDQLLLYTDGVCEARDSGGAFFSLAEHAAGALTAGHGDGDALLDTLLSSLGDHQLDAAETDVNAADDVLLPRSRAPAIGSV
jgi:serine phosphatase RsbU (regulator of sigma subunit)